MERSTRERPALFRALGKNSPPEQIVVGEVTYQLAEVFKHDSWAATALYHCIQKSGDPKDGDQHGVVCKFNRVQSILGLPTGWLGRLLANREAFAMQRMVNTVGIPNDLGAVWSEGKHFPNAVAHPFVPGHPLGSKEEVNDKFFPDLLSYLLEVHEQKMAYVDLHKRENILVGEDGKPYLIDFQICYRSAAMRSFTLPTTKLILKLL